MCLDLRGPDLTDLSFIDLPGTMYIYYRRDIPLSFWFPPGIISNVANGEDRGNIEAVKNMVKEHIQGNTLILLTITMRGSDIHTYRNKC